MDPMTEIFYDESTTILHDMRNSLVSRKDSEIYGQDVIQEIFRGVHTLKADSAMMLYENMAQVSKELESLLYCFRGEGKQVDDTTRFDAIVYSYLDYFEAEMDKLPLGMVPKEEPLSLEKQIRSYTEEIVSGMKEEEVESYQKNIQKPKRQIFYIASATEEGQRDSNVPQDSIQMQSDSEDAILTASKKKKKKYVITEKEKEQISKGARNLMKVVNTLEYSIKAQKDASSLTESLARLKEVYADITMVKNSLADTDFVPVAKKMEIVVDEMSAKLGKPVKLLVKGEHTPIEREQREKISGALIHIIRNAVDHGIEDIEERERYGKSPMGMIRLKFYTEDGKLRVSVKDDGAGVNREAVLQKARMEGMLHKKEEEYTDKEVMDLLLKSGLTTAGEVGEFSGRGVGMDVVAHNVAQLGGKLRITSKPGLGTTVTMKF